MLEHSVCGLCSGARVAELGERLTVGYAVPGVGTDTAKVAFAAGVTGVTRHDSRVRASVTVPDCTRRFEVRGCALCSPLLSTTHLTRLRRVEGWACP